MKEVNRALACANRRNRQKEKKLNVLHTVLETDGFFLQGGPQVHPGELLQMKNRGDVNLLRLILIPWIVAASISDGGLGTKKHTRNSLEGSNFLDDRIFFLELS